MEVTMLDALVGTYKADRPTLVSAHGCKVTTEDGRELLDFVSGIGVNALGYGHPVVTQAIESAVATGLLHTSNLYRNPAAQKLAQLLTERSFADTVRTRGTKRQERRHTASIGRCTCQGNP